MTKKTLYYIVEIDLSKERSVNQPYELGAQKNFIYILTCSGTAQMSISGGDYFPLRVGLRIILSPEEQREFEVINEAQPGKNLVLFLGTQKQCEVKNG